MAVEGPHTPVTLRSQETPSLPPSAPLPSSRPTATLPPHSLATKGHGSVRTLAGHMGWWGTAKRIPFYI